MKNSRQIINLTLLIFGAILASNTDGSVKTIGIIFIATVVLKTSSAKNCFLKVRSKKYRLAKQRNII